MTEQEFVEIRDLLIDRTQRYDEVGFPSIDGEYDIGGFPLPI